MPGDKDFTKSQNTSGSETDTTGHQEKNREIAQVFKELVTNLVTNRTTHEGSLFPLLGTYETADGEKIKCSLWEDDIKKNTYKLRTDHKEDISLLEPLRQVFLDKGFIVELRQWTDPLAGTKGELVKPKEVFHLPKWNISETIDSIDPSIYYQKINDLLPREAQIFTRSDRDETVETIGDAMVYISGFAFPPGTFDRMAIEAVTEIGGESLTKLIEVLKTIHYIQELPDGRLAFDRQEIWLLARSGGQ